MANLKRKDMEEVIFLDDDGADDKRKKPRMKTSNTPASVVSGKSPISRLSTPTVIVIEDDDEKVHPETIVDDAAIAKALDDFEKTENAEINMTSRLIDVINVADQLDLKEKLEHDQAVVKKISSLSIVHPSLEHLDPNPDISKLFLEFDKKFFNGFLSTQAVLVQWDQNLGKDAGRFYKTSNGLSTISLSAALLSLRLRRDLVETLLHEMIHCYILLKNIKDDNAHGSVFQSHLNRINKASGSKITIYHHFHDELAYISKPSKARN